MAMRVIHVEPGSTDWLQHRLQHRNASESAAVLSCSPYVSRIELLTAKKLGLVGEVDRYTQLRFDRGHEWERLARPIAELIIGDDLVPVVGVLEGTTYGASFDGLTVDWETNWEHKSLNDEIREALPHEGRDSHGRNDARRLPKVYRVQMEHQLMVCGGKRVLFSATLWSDDGTLLEERHAWYYPDAELRREIQGAWPIFEEELEDFVPPEEVAKPMAAPAPQLPVLLVQVEGRVVTSNLVEFERQALAMIAAVNETLEEEQDFADAEVIVKDFDAGAKLLRAKKKEVLAGGAASVMELLDAMERVAKALDDKRINLTRKITAEKKNIRQRILMEGQAALRRYIDELDGAPGGRKFMPDAKIEAAADFESALHNKRGKKGLSEGASTALARGKLEAKHWHDRIAINLAKLREHQAQAHLFADVAQLVLKDPEAVKAIVDGRIAQAAAAEQRRLEAERERIRAEEAARLQREQEAAARAERERQEREAAAAKAEADRQAMEARRQQYLQEQERQQQEQQQRFAEQMAKPAAADGPAVRVEGLSAAPVPAANVVPMPSPVPANAVPTLRLGQINERLQHCKVTADDLAALGFPAAARERGAVLYHEQDFERICTALIGHLVRVRDLRKAA